MQITLTTLHRLIILQRSQILFTEDFTFTPSFFLTLALAEKTHQKTDYRVFRKDHQVYLDDVLISAICFLIAVIIVSKLFQWKLIILP